MSIITEMNILGQHIAENWKEMTRRDRLEIKRSLEYMIQNKLGPKKEKAVRKVLSQLHGV